MWQISRLVAEGFHQQRRRNHLNCPPVMLWRCGEDFLRVTELIVTTTPWKFLMLPFTLQISSSLGLLRLNIADCFAAPQYSRKVDDWNRYNLLETFCLDQNKVPVLWAYRNLKIRFPWQQQKAVFFRPPVAAGALPQIASLIHGPIASSGLLRTKPALAEGPTTGFRSLRRRPWRKTWT